MSQITFSDQTNPSIAILIKDINCKKAGLTEHYIAPLINLGVPAEAVCAYSLPYNGVAKLSAKVIKEYSEILLPELVNQDINLLLVCDAEYFKYLTNNKKAEIHLGYVLPCVISGYTHINVVLGASYAGLFHNPGVQLKIDQSLGALSAFHNGHYLPPGTDLFKKVELVKDLQRIDNLLAHLMTLPKITADIETLSLHVRDAGLSTIAFAQDTEVAYAFAVDTHLGFGKPVRDRLKKFFTEYQGTIIWHNCGYDLKIIIYNLWMKHPLDRKGMLEGIEVMTRNFDDTRLIAYLALNSCSRTSFSLKNLAQEFAGNYAEQEIDNALAIQPDDLLKYNCVDAMATWYVYNKYYQQMVDDQQLELYQGLFKDSVKLLLEIELVGMPINMEKVLYAETELQKIEAEHLAAINKSPIIQQFEKKVQYDAYLKKQSELKKKIVTPAEFTHIKFNPSSGPQLQELLYDQLQLPIINKTKKKKPATGNKVLSKLKKHTQDPQILELLDALIGLSKVTKILTAFIPTFKNAWLKSDGCHYLHGNFNLGFVVSGRLSCSSPNLQQIPSGSTYGKLIKDCFSAAKGWLMAGADFNSLEDRISALTTKDPNKLKVYTDGYDGHSLRAYTYYKDQMPDIIDTVDSINSIQDKYEALRGRSKAPTFALTYQGTYITLMNNCGMSEQEAKEVEAKYHELYVVSDEWVQDKLMQASKDGYITVAFGLRVRTPLLKQVMYGSSMVPFEAQAEARTAGNALGQSYGLLNNRAACEFRARLEKSPYRMDVFLISLIHDATYVIMRNDVDVVKWVNDNLPDCMKWQELPDIQHPEVKLGGNLDLFYPSWKVAYTLPNNATVDEIIKISKTPPKK